MTGPRDGIPSPAAGREPSESAVRVPSVRPLGRRIEVDRDAVEHGFASLVLTIVELLRQLMERQALRRVDVGDLTDDQIERIGETLMALEEQMGELREHFGLSPEDLDLDLGPLGPLLPRDPP
ncbi:gas vesicle protein K [Dactylosporangium sp. NPDC005555]|uniref:gas vesicle protein K n=1 Tax=Dactylosporangium sp. NPDC005555 TaxID=3154889 RepID=UPI0033A98A98